MAKTVTLDYTVDTANQSASAYQARVLAIDLFQGELDFLEMTIVSDGVSVIDGSTLRREIVLGSDSDDVAELRAKTTNLYRAALNLLTPARVTAGDPVIV
jgi:hypothetical protein